MSNSTICILFFIVGFVIAIAAKTFRDRFLIFKIKCPNSVEEAAGIATDLLGGKVMELLAYVKCVSRVTRLSPSCLIYGLADTLNAVAKDEEADERTADGQK